MVHSIAFAVTILASGVTSGIASACARGCAPSLYCFPFVQEQGLESHLLQYLDLVADVTFAAAPGNARLAHWRAAVIEVSKRRKS